jgi:hypothetical protein
MSDQSESDSKNMALSQTPLAKRLAALDQLEQELIRKAGAMVQPTKALSWCDFFVIGAMRRTLAQIKGFRTLIESKNFPCAAGIVRMQIDTAMRMNGLTLVEDREAMAKAIIDGAAMNAFKAADGNKLSDAYLRKQLAQGHPWVNSVYDGTSDFIHLSGRHFFSAIQKTDNDTQMVYFSISGEDPTRPDSDYFEIVDGFLTATKLAATLILAYWMSLGLKPGDAQPATDAAPP